MQYVIISYLGEPELVKDDKSKVKMFDDYSDAVDEARECDNGIVVPLSTSLMETIAHAANYVEDKYVDHDDNELLNSLDNLLGLEDNDE